MYLVGLPDGRPHDPGLQRGPSISELDLHDRNPVTPIRRCGGAPEQRRRTPIDGPRPPHRLDWPAVYAAIQQLRPEHQTLLTLRYFENMDYEEIGRVVDARPATIRVTLHRTLRRLQEVLQSDLGGEP
jgi:DNA-directed RNA polymerase specialized sigma24 family protein